MKKYKNLIWDFNGTIIDDVQLCCDSYNFVLAAYGQPKISLQRLSEIWCLPIRNFFEHFEINNLDQVIEPICAQFHKYYSARWSACKLQPGVESLITWAKSRNMEQAVLSGHPHDYLVEMLKHFQLLSQFLKVRGVDTIVAVDKIQVGKDLLRDLGWKPEETLMLGDSNFDFETAQALGADCCLVARGIQNENRLAACGVPVYKNLNEVVSVLE